MLSWKQWGRQKLYILDNLRKKGLDLGDDDESYDDFDEADDDDEILPVRGRDGE